MVGQFKKFLAENKLVKPDQKILLAVSGGIDSMVMANLFLRTGYMTGIAHCNFSLRGEESDGDELFVRKFAEENKIPFHTIRFETKEYAREKGLSVQMAARELRYGWFEEIRIKNNYDLTAVAHNLNDNIETLIINLTRGTGLAGLSGMRPMINTVIRPLLFATRKSIEKYSEREGIRFREDRSNADTKYTRNKIRHLVLPVLKEINPSIETTLNETAERLYDLNEIITDYISRLRNTIIEKKEDHFSFNINSLKEYTHNRAVIFELFRPYGLTSAQTDDLMKVINGKTGGRIHTDTHRIIKNRKELIATPDEIREEEHVTIKTISGFRKVSCIESAEYVSITDALEISSDPSVALISTEKLTFPLVIRKWKSGDYFYPFGMKQKKKLSDYFIDKKFSILDKENKLILESGGNIVWIIGERLDNRFRITEQTKKGLLLRAARKPLLIRKVK